MDKPKQPQPEATQAQDAPANARDVSRAAPARDPLEPTRATEEDVFHTVTSIQDLPVKGREIAALGAYGPNANAALDVSRKEWDEAAKHGMAWSQDPKSRLAVRMFSRGVLGAAAFTAGGLLTKKWMTGKNLYDPLKGFAEQKNPLQMTAKLIDTVVGAPIEATVTAIAGKEAGLASVRFRPTHKRSFGTEMRGRSLGDEVVNITFDFFSASVGDALGRDMAAWVDPHADKGWKDENGNFSLSKTISSMTRAAVRYVTYNGGEDWAVAIPYAYFMKAQRHLINRASPGFAYDFDRGLNGGSFKMRDNKIVGNYNVEGLLDLQSRFTVYNIGTLMFREVYNYADNLLHGRAASLYGAAGENKEPKTLLQGAGDLLKWAARSAVKGTIIMTPAVPFFWISRTPQTKHRAKFIDPEKGLLGIPGAGANGRGDTVAVNTRDLPSLNTYVDYWQYEHKPGQPLNQHRTIHPGGLIGAIEPQLVAQAGSRSGNGFDPHARTFGPVDATLNAFGKANYELAHAVSKPAEWVDNRAAGITHPIKEALGIDTHNAGRFVRPMVYASAAYTPYMYAKAEFANLWDNGKMDMAAERMIDGAAKLNWGEFKKGAHEVYSAFLQRPLPDPQREAEAQRRTLLDTSAPDVFLETQAVQEAKKQVSEKVKKLRPDTVSDAQTPNWRERVVAAPKENALDPTNFKAKGGDGAALDDYKRAKPEKSPEQLVEREAMRKALEELHPPTNAIN